MTFSKYLRLKRNILISNLLIISHKPQKHKILSYIKCYHERTFNSLVTMRITKGYDSTPRGSHYTSRENSVVQNSVEKVVVTQQQVVTKNRNKV